MVEGLKLDPARPLIICDADEVLLQFISGLERYLETQGCILDLTSFAIHGNVRRRDSGQAVANEDVTRFIAAFFENHTRTMDVVPGAAAALAELSARAQIIILSNLPEVARIARTENLADHGIDYPVIAGSGLKGATVKRMIDGFASRWSSSTTSRRTSIRSLPKPRTSIACISSPTRDWQNFCRPPKARTAASTIGRRQRLDRVGDWRVTDMRIGVDLGGTKIEIAALGAGGDVRAA